MQEIKFTISGLRGVWGENLTEQVVEKYITNFAVYLQKRSAKKIILGRDARESGPIISDIAKNTLTHAGIDVVDVGITPTPTILFLVKHTQADGAIIISASHNPREYNGIKFISNRAQYITQQEVDEIKSYTKEDLLVAEKKGDYEKNDTLDEMHVEHILKHIDVNMVKEKAFRVVLDPINSAGYKLGPLLLDKLGCTPITINPFPTGDFAHIPEPLPENLKDLGEKVKLFKAHVGFALDPDADRLVLCDETGSVVFEEYTLSLAIKAVLAKTPGDIVTNLSTSNTNEDLVQEVGYQNYRTKVGEANVVDGIMKYNAIIGGEGGGGVIYPKVNLCRDSLTGIALTLELLASENKTLSEIVDTLPKYEFIKEKISFNGDLKEKINKIINILPEGKVDTQDGLRIDFSDRSWIQLRASNTEPIIRIFGEAKQKSTLLPLIEKIRSAL